MLLYVLTCQGCDEQMLRYGPLLHPYMIPYFLTNDEPLAHEILLSDPGNKVSGSGMPLDGE